MPKEIEVLYRTSDGLLFPKSKDAKEHQDIIDIEEWYNADPLDGISIATLQAWLKKHKKDL